MKKWPIAVGLACVICALAIQSVAQQAPERRPEVRESRPNAAPGEGARPDPGREGGPGRPDGGAGRPERPRLPDGVTPEMIRRYLVETRGQMGGAGGAQLDAMRNYLDVFDRYSRLSRDPTAAGVSAVVTAGEILRARGADTAIAYFNKVMADVKNESVQRAIRLQLIELYKASGQQDKALEHLQTLMTSAPAGGTIGAAEGDAGGRPRPQQ
jgi:hypothetical protein